jgi:hypothetical protein
MDGTSHTQFGDPTAWEISGEMTRGTLAVATRNGPRTVGHVSSFWGSFYVRHCGRLAGFSIHLGLTPAAGTKLATLRPAPDRTLFWEAVDLALTDERDFSGECRLQIAERRIMARTYGKVVTAATPYSNHPYLKIILSTDFRGLQLNWPADHRYMCSRVEMRFFTEIHQKRATRSA